MLSRLPDLPDLLDLVYLDQHCAVVNKPSGLLAVPGRGPERQDCVSARLQRLCPWCIAQPAAHRLDMDTSGLMVLGLTREAQRTLSAQFAARTVEKRYLALLDGLIPGESGEIRLAFRLDPENRPHQVHDSLRGKLGVTRWQKLWQENGKTCIALHPQTGRTHQLRLHASHPLGLACPIAGDRLYGRGRTGERLCLHAALLAFCHPDSGEKLRFFSPPPFLDAAGLDRLSHSFLWR